MELLTEKLMTEETPIADYAADAEIAAPKKRGRPPKAAEENTEPVNTIVNLEVPKIVVTKAEPEPEIEVPLTEQTRLEMEAGQRALTRLK